MLDKAFYDSGINAYAAGVIRTRNGASELMPTENTQCQRGNLTCSNAVPSDVALGPLDCRTLPCACMAEHDCRQSRSGVGEFGHDCSMTAS
jgi:hypothetical protein